MTEDKKKKTKRKKTTKKKTPVNDHETGAAAIKRKKFKIKETVPEVRPYSQMQPPHEEHSDLHQPRQSAIKSKSVGQILQAVRIEKSLNLEDVSAEINIRVVQLRAIEEDDIEALPGRAYALGFIRSYANHLGLDGASIAQKFKIEQGGFNAVGQELHFPEPIAEGPHPNILVIGAAVFFSVIVLILWAVFSGDGDINVDVAEYIPPAPNVGTISGVTQEKEGADTVLTGRNLLSVVASASPPPQGPLTPDALKIPEVAPSLESSLREVPVLVPEVKETSEIKILRPAGRIVIEARQASWVEVRDKSQKTIFKRVLRKGDKYTVPDKEGLVLLTSNAGGIDIIVDDKKVQSLGGVGEIIRGIDLNPEELKKVKIKTRQRRSRR